MLSGPELGEALRLAMELKGVGVTAVGAEFGVTPPSVHDRRKHGRIHKRHLDHLVQYFRDVVGPEHWGIAPGTMVSTSRQSTFLAAAEAWRKTASPRSQAVIDNLTLLAKKNALSDADWQLIQDLAGRFKKRDT